ncbi:hypothetical protein ACIHJG_37580 [Streptomyces sp. NPDC052415]|uniref:hypothetical protein n=1 Tax=Streptomyces sp. NPDC052415 TaxID=3365690 RepID=UPI0037D2A095
MSDLNRSEGTLGVRGRPGRQSRLVYLDDFTLSLIATMLKEPAARQPHSPTPHLRVMRVTAHNSAGSQMSRKAFQYFFRRLGSNAEQVHIDRIWGGPGRPLIRFA